MPDIPLDSIVTENAEKVLRTYFGVDEATATVQEELECDEEWLLDCTFEGEFDNRKHVFVHQTQTGFTSVSIVGVEDNTAKLTYMQKEGPRPLSKDGKHMIQLSI